MEAGARRGQVRPSSPEVLLPRALRGGVWRLLRDARVEETAGPLATCPGIFRKGFPEAKASAWDLGEHTACGVTRWGTSQGSPGQGWEEAAEDRSPCFCSFPGGIEGGGGPQLQASSWWSQPNTGPGGGAGGGGGGGGGPIVNVYFGFSTPKTPPPGNPPPPLEPSQQLLLETERPGALCPEPSATSQALLCQGRVE